MSKGQRPGNPLPWKSVDEPFNLEKSIELTQDWDYVTGENPSSNGVASARGMAKASASLFLTPDLKNLIEKIVLPSPIEN